MRLCPLGDRGSGGWSVIPGGWNGRFFCFFRVLSDPLGGTIPVGGAKAMMRAVLFMELGMVRACV